MCGMNVVSVKLEAGFTHEWLTLREPINGGKFWWADCRCGGETKVSRWHWMQGLRRSCGCRKRTKQEFYICKKCLILKPRSEFYVRKNGCLSEATCKKCTIEIASVRSVLRQQRIRIEALRHYGGGDPRCSCCHVAHIEFLAIDHIDGGGNKHRKEQNIRNISRWLAKQKNLTGSYPPGFRVLCHNCNAAIGLYGKCPHQKPQSAREQIQICTNAAVAHANTWRAIAGLAR